MKITVQLIETEHPNHPQSRTGDGKIDGPSQRAIENLFPGRSIRTICDGDAKESRDRFERGYAEKPDQSSTNDEAQDVCGATETGDILGKRRHRAGIEGPIVVNRWQ